MKGIAEEAEKNNFPLAFYFDMTKKSYLEFIERSRQSKNCGIITYPYFKMDPEVEDVISDYQANGGKIVLIEGGSSRWQWHNCTSVSIDNYHGGRLAAEHLIKKDVKLFITQEYTNIPERTFGFTDTVKKAGRELCVINLLEDIIDRVKKTGSYPVGIFLPRDQDAVTLLCKLQQNSINVGKDVLLIGYGDLYLVQNLSPALTTVMQPFAEIGKIALQKLVADIYGKTIESTLIKPKLITRRST
jgi:LacI family transcriptional regulator